MRESRTFAERTKVLKSDEALKKYFLVYEGSDTELIYFDAVNSMRENIGINPLIELIPIIRSYSEEGWSNPKKILDRIIENLEESKAERISYETLLNRMMDYFYETKVITTSKVLAKSMWKTMVHVCTEELQKSLQEEVEDIETDCNAILELLQQEYDVTHVVSDISDIIKDGGLTYAEGFQLCITNPCFEFWLLLHFDDVFELDTDQLLENPKVTSKRRYAEQELRRIYPKYKKSSYQAEELVGDIDKAIRNEKEFCEEIEGLENSVGSNIGRLIEDMRK